MKQPRILETRPKRKTAALVLAAILLFTASATNLHPQTYTDLYNLGSSLGDPANPAWIGLFTQGRDGNLYSTSQGGGTLVKGVAYGTVFQLTPTGNMTVLYSFQNNKDGVFPNGGLTLGTDGYLYGTTFTLGLYGEGSVFKIATDGTSYTTLYSFKAPTSGYNPVTAPIQGVDGNFYGTTQ